MKKNSNEAKVMFDNAKRDLDKLEYMLKGIKNETLKIN